MPNTYQRNFADLTYSRSAFGYRVYAETPAGSFAESGTYVNTISLQVTKPKA